MLVQLLTVLLTDRTDAESCRVPNLASRPLSYHRRLQRPRLLLRFLLARTILRWGTKDPGCRSCPETPELRGMQLANSDVIASLIDTYRNLNLKIRPLDSATGNSASVLEAMAALRESEIRSSQLIKLMSLGDGSGDAAIPEPPPSANPNNVRVLLSEFGTAREAILAAVREMSEEDINAARPGFSAAGSIGEVLKQIAERDKKILASV